MRRALVAASLLVSGCVTVSPERMAAWRREQSAASLRCGWAETAVERELAGGAWEARCEGRSYVCRPRYDAVAPTVAAPQIVCEETAESEAETLRRVAVDRLALETGCPAEQIAVTQAAEWGRGRERAFRLTACGRPYVCTTAPGRTDCKAALGQ